jgi:hypothetical protein
MNLSMMMNHVPIHLHTDGHTSAVAVCRYASFFPWLVKGPSMGRMTWDLATLQYHRWAGRAGWEYHRWAGRAGWEADSDHAVDRRGRLWIRAYMPRRTSWTYRVASEVLPYFQEHPSQPEQCTGCRRLYLGGAGRGRHGRRHLQRF